MYEFNEQARALVDLVRRMVRDHQAPLEARLLRGEKLTWADYKPGREAARKAGLWGLWLPPEVGGAHLSLVNRLANIEQNSKCLSPIRFGGEVPHAMVDLQGEQKARYLDPSLSDAKRYSWALTEPGGGADPARAVSSYAKWDGASWSLTARRVGSASSRMPMVC